MTRRHIFSTTTTNHLIAFAAVGLALFFSITTAIGMIKNYSPVPFWDMWDGYLTFYTQITDGVTAAWWAQHAEHRIVIGNILFWLDLYLFGGVNIFLIAMNFFLVFCIATMLGLIAANIFPMPAERNIRLLTIASIYSLSFSWVQQENLNWAFQASFFPALLCPIAAFYTLHKALTSDNRLTFWIALALGLISAGTMANGLATLPLMALMAFTYGASKSRVIALIAVWVAVTGAYFHNYKSPELNGSLIESLLHHKAEMVRYVFIYLGGIYSYMFNAGSQRAAEISGFVSLIFLTATLYHTIFKTRARTMDVVLVFISGFIIVSACAAAAGRLKFGMDQAMSSRYMTYSLTYWSVLILLMASTLRIYIQRYNISALTFMAIPVFLVPYQLNALQDSSEKNFNKLLAGLAMEIKVRDSQQIMNIFPWIDIGFILAERPRDRNLSIFGNPLIRNIHDDIGNPYQDEGLAFCAGSLDKVIPIENEPNYMKIEGTISGAANSETPRAVAVVNSDNLLVGYALTKPKSNLDNSSHSFIGYLKTSELGRELFVRGRLPSCTLAHSPNPRSFKLTPS